MQGGFGITVSGVQEHGGPTLLVSKGPPRTHVQVTLSRAPPCTAPSAGPCL